MEEEDDSNGNGQGRLRDSGFEFQRWKVDWIPNRTTAGTVAMKAMTTMGMLFGGRRAP